MAEDEGFYYSSYDKPKEGTVLSGMTDKHKVYFHKLGTKQSEDKLIFGGEKTPRRYLGAVFQKIRDILLFLQPMQPMEMNCISKI
jgi:hypothetical protein